MGSRPKTSFVMWHMSETRSGEFSSTSSPQPLGSFQYDQYDMINMINNSIIILDFRPIGHYIFLRCLAVFRTSLLYCSGCGTSFQAILRVGRSLFDSLALWDIWYLIKFYHWCYSMSVWRCWEVMSQSFGVKCHQYVDDNHFYCSFSPNSEGALNTIWIL